MKKSVNKAVDKESTKATDNCGTSSSPVTPKLPPNSLIKILGQIQEEGYALGYHAGLVGTHISRITLPEEIVARASGEQVMEMEDALHRSYSLGFSKGTNRRTNERQTKDSVALVTGEALSHVTFPASFPTRGSN